MKITFNRVELGPNTGNVFVEKANEGNVSSVCAYISDIRRGKESLSVRAKSDAKDRDVARWSELEKIIASNALYDAFATGKEVPTEESLDLLKGKLRPYILEKTVQFRKLFIEDVNVKELQRMIVMD